MKNNVSPRYLLLGIRLEKLKQRTWILTIFARLLLFLALLFRLYG